MLPSKICYFWCICVSILFTGRLCFKKHFPGVGDGGGGGLLWLISAGFVLLASQNPFLIIVYSEAKII